MTAGRAISILPGQRNGGLTVIGRASGRVLWCVCDCGQFKTVSSSNFRQTFSCGCVLDAKLETKTLDAQISALVTIYQRNALSRGREFSLSRKQFTNFILARCYYCGAPPMSFIRTKRDKRLNRQGLAYNGIDREQQDVGYVSTNCRTCCAVCNYAKGTLTATQFISHCGRVATWCASTPRSIFD